MKRSLELKIPPVALVLLVAALMWLTAQLTPQLALSPMARRWLLIAFVGAGLLCVLAGAISFVRAKTTVNPTAPTQSSALVTSGVYRFCRNPMYLGFLLILIGWGLYLASTLALLWCFGFILYMNRFQIQPEERALQEKFGEAFRHYQARTRRWL